jgi:hypothetical protein
MLESGFRKWIASTDTTVLVCWDLGHIWLADIYDNIEKRPHGAHMLIGSCDRGCGVERARYLNSSWSPDGSKNSYKYPRGYSPKEYMEGNPFFMSAEHRGAIRKEIARRSREDAKSEGATIHTIKFKSTS